MLIAVCSTSSNRVSSSELSGKDGIKGQVGSGLGGIGHSNSSSGRERHGEGEHLGVTDATVADKSVVFDGGGGSSSDVLGEASWCGGSSSNGLTRGRESGIGDSGEGNESCDLSEHSVITSN